VSRLFYSTSEVARLFKVNRVTIYRWVKEGKIKAYEIGKNIKIPVSEVGRLLKGFGFSLWDIHAVYDGSNDSRLVESAQCLVENQNEKKLVVAIDDNREILGVIEGLFEKTDLKKTCKLLTFSDSLEAAVQIGAAKPDLLLLDIRMSGLDGIELAKKIKAVFEDVKIVFMSGYPEEEKGERIRELDIVKFLLKPINVNTMYTVIQHALV
jgi:excisionase family DNA binding protein